MADFLSIRKRVGTLTIGLAIVGLIALLCLIASVLFATRFVEETIKYAVDNIASRSGLSVYLVRGVVILATMPFFWAVGKFTKNIWGLINLGWDSMALYKNWYGRTIVGYVGVYFLVIYWASLGALNYKYCAETPEGTWTSDSPGKDPVYGIDLKTCSMDQKLALREATGHLKAPGELTITDAEHYKWFDPVTRRPVVWYSTLPNNEYRFFDGRGVDPHNGQELKPVTSEIIDRVTQLENAARREAEEQSARLAERQREEERERAQKEAAAEEQKAAEREAAEERQAEIESQINVIRPHYDQVLARMSGETDFWQRLGDDLSKQGRSLRPEIRSALSNARMIVNRCGDVLAARQPDALNDCLDEATRKLDELDGYK